MVRRWPSARLRQRRRPVRLRRGVPWQCLEQRDLGAIERRAGHAGNQRELSRDQSGVDAGQPDAVVHFEPRRRPRRLPPAADCGRPRRGSGRAGLVGIECAQSLALGRGDTARIFVVYAQLEYLVDRHPRDRCGIACRARQITFGSEKIEKVALSPDGTTLAYDSDRNGQADIWKIPVAGGTPEQLTHGPYPKFVNEWSPDGQEIVFHSIREGTRRDVLVVSADGTKTEVVASAREEEQHAGWAPDGNSIVFDAGESAEVGRWEAFVATRARRGAPWQKSRPLTTNGSADPKWSPDGRLIAFVSRGQLRTIAPDGTGERVVMDASRGDRPEPTYPVWSRDSRTIYYKAYDRDRQSTMWAVPAAGGEPRLLLRFDDPTRRSLRREFATDGRRLYFTVARDESDIWTMELVRR